MTNHRDKDAKKVKREKAKRYFLKTKNILNRSSNKYEETTEDTEYRYWSLILLLVSYMYNNYRG